jgi:Fe-S cluster assembly ATP-binding protein
MALLEIRNLLVEVDGREVLKGVDLSLESGEIHVLMGPNASGKTSLALTIMGYPRYRVMGGEALFKGKDILKLDITRRAQLGIGIAHQAPPEVRGVKLRDILRLILGQPMWEPQTELNETIASKFLEKVGLPKDPFLTRDLNLGFSGGERKRSELAQVFAQAPSLLILDEPDSGVDIDSLRLIGQEIIEFKEDLGCAVLVITHHRHILHYLKPTICHIMYAGRIVERGDPECLIACIEREGYKGYINKMKVCEKIGRMEKDG